MTTNTSATVPSNQGTPVAVITTEQFLSSIDRSLPNHDGSAADPEETLSKLEAVIHLMSGCIDHEENTLDVNMEHFDWALLLAIDLVREIDSKLEKLRELHRASKRELERHLDDCHLIPADPAKWVRPHSEREVAP